MATKRSIIHIVSCTALVFVLAACRVQGKTTATPTEQASAASLLSASVQTLEAEPTPTLAPIVLENGWYLYQDPDGEFSFAYPPDAILSAGQNPVDLAKNITIQFQIPDKTYQGMSLRSEPNPKRLTGAEIAKQLYERSAQQPAAAEFTKSLQQIQVGGIAAVQTTITAANTELTIIVPYEAKVLIAAPVHETSVLKVEAETLELFYQILNSMKFNLTQ